MITYCNFFHMIHMVLKYLLQTIHFSRYLRLGCCYPPCCTTGTMTSTRSEEGKNSYGILICKKNTCLHSIPKIVFNITSQVGEYAHLRIGPTWKRTGCMPCSVICTSWFGRAWPAGQLITSSCSSFSSTFWKKRPNFEITLGVKRSQS